MNQSITLFIPGTEVDDYGRPSTSQLIVKARVQYSSKVIESASGTRTQSSLEVDLMPDIPVNYGTKAKYEDPFGKVVEGAMIAINESTNLAGNKVFFRTVNIG
ncbi:hypothetical protein BKM15_25940 [Pseudomonas syringae pv. syringae]|nr:hypothetical protein BKM15_25940 [Pseudomonas syringae pv. syringae]